MSVENYTKPELPNYDFEEGIKVGLLCMSLINVQSGIKKPISGERLLSQGLSYSKIYLNELVNDYSYESHYIKLILETSGISNPEWVLEYVMTDGNPKERVCNDTNCKIILTSHSLVNGWTCGRHEKQ